MAETFTDADKLKEIEREIEMRKRLWSEPRSKLLQRRLDIMESIAWEFRARAEKERLL
jgi:hypothetical protein